MIWAPIPCLCKLRSTTDFSEPPCPQPSNGEAGKSAVAGGWSSRWSQRFLSGAARGRKTGMTGALVSQVTSLPTSSEWLLYSTHKTCEPNILPKSAAAAFTRFLFPFLAAAPLWMALRHRVPPSVPAGPVCSHPSS